jgi:hypothetical protein
MLRRCHGKKAQQRQCCECDVKLKMLEGLGQPSPTVMVSHNVGRRLANNNVPNIETRCPKVYPTLDHDSGVPRLCWCGRDRYYCVLFGPADEDKRLRLVVDNDRLLVLRPGTLSPILPIRWNLTGSFQPSSFGPKTILAEIRSWRRRQ